MTERVTIYSTENKLEATYGAFLAKIPILWYALIVGYIHSTDNNFGGS